MSKHQLRKPPINPSQNQRLSHKKRSPTKYRKKLNKRQSVSLILPKKFEKMEKESDEDEEEEKKEEMVQHAVLEDQIEEDNSSVDSMPRRNYSSRYRGAKKSEQILPQSSSVVEEEKKQEVGRRASNSLKKIKRSVRAPALSHESERKSSK